MGPVPEWSGRPVLEGACIFPQSDVRGVVAVRRKIDFRTVLRDAVGVPELCKPDVTAESLRYSRRACRFQVPPPVIIPER